MKRRRFYLSSLGAAAWFTGMAVRAQGGPIEGTHYVRLSQPLPGGAGRAARST